MNHETVLVPTVGRPNRTFDRPVIPLDQLDLIRATPRWPSDTVLLIAQLWNDGKSVKEIAKTLVHPPGTSPYTPAQVTNKANNILYKLGIRERNSSKDATKPEPDKKPERKTRKCLKCRDKFISCWSGERVCPKCKQSKEWLSGGDFPA